MSLKKLSDLLHQFAEERSWKPFHTPKNLIMALSGEMGELCEIFQWLSEQEASEIMKSESAASVKEELADIFLYLIRLADILGVDLIEAAFQKMELNAKKYPVETSKGSHKKHYLLES